jgi:tetratricopeptide (TPR) repeat protein
VSGFVVCRSCGTRIKAGRGHCLKCFEPLPDPDAPERVPLSVTLGLSRNTEIVVAAGTALAVVLLAAVIWRTWPTRENDEAVPLNIATTPTAAASPASDAPEPSTLAPAEPPPAVGADASAASASSEADLEALRADYEAKLNDRPKDADLNNKLGQVLERMGRGEEAARHFDRAVALAPLEPAYRLNLARAAGALGQWDRSIDQYREAVRLRPKDYATLTALGLMLQKKGDDQAAVVEFQKAHKINPEGPGAALGLAMSLEKAGRIDDALKEFHQYLEITPPPADVEQVRAHIALLMRGRPQVK